MKYLSNSLFMVLLCAVFMAYTPYSSPKLFKANDPNIHYVGRIDFTNPKAPRFWAAGVYIQAKFEGAHCEIMLNDQLLYGNSHNYIEIAIDDQPAYRVKLTNDKNILKVPDGLSEGEHVITICKDTESHIGYIEFTGLKCDALLPLPVAERKMEFIGDSITSGSSMDLSTPCGTGQWYDQHNAYMSFGPATARNLKAQWVLTSVSGIGLMHSCCNMALTMPQVFNKVNIVKDSATWDFKRYQPDVVAICLGQNDGRQDSVAFCSAYVKFINTVRAVYPQADIICLTSPMADNSMAALFDNYLTGITKFENKAGDQKIFKYAFAKRYHKGCGGHPDLQDHKEIADELTAYVKKVKGW